MEAGTCVRAEKEKAATDLDESEPTSLGKDG